jgi:hypothetical protein
MGSGAVIYVPSFIKIGSGIQELIGVIHRHTHRQQRDLINLLNYMLLSEVSIILSKQSSSYISASN